MPLDNTFTNFSTNFPITAPSVAQISKVPSKPIVPSNVFDILGENEDSHKPSSTAPLLFQLKPASFQVGGDFFAKQSNKPFGSMHSGVIDADL